MVCSGIELYWIRCLTSPDERYVAAGVEFIYLGEEPAVEFIPDYSLDYSIYICITPLTIYSGPDCMQQYSFSIFLKLFL